ncbi:MAG: zinc ribbon domain-containing protein [Dehalococcoidia bacterium]|nr:zinc ribbon domain-containing protein [Dehalococcoidia bacterium]
MALYEYYCAACGTRTEKRMPMSDVLQLIPCPTCGKQAQKVIGGWSVIGRAQESIGDGPAPWEDGGDSGDGPEGGIDHGGGHSHDWGGGHHGHSHGGHSHSHGPGGHTH